MNLRANIIIIILSLALHQIQYVELKKAKQQIHKTKDFKSQNKENTLQKDGDLQTRQEIKKQNNIRATKLINKKLFYQLPASYSKFIGSYFNKSVKRVISLRDRYAHQTLQIIPEPLKTIQQLQNYILLVKNQENEYLISIELLLSDISSTKDSKSCKLKQSLQENELYLYKYDIVSCASQHSLKFGQIQLTVRYIWGHRYQPLPKKISLDDFQSLLFVTKRYPLSLYETQFTSISFQISKQVSRYNDYSKFQQWSSSDNKISLYPVQEEQDDKTVLKYKQQVSLYISPLQYKEEEIFIHFMANLPLVYFKKVEKRVEISHWGNISINQNYQIRHEGAELARQFSRADYSYLKPLNGRWSFKMMRTSLPVQTWGLSVRDFIGNISSTNAIREHNRVDLMIRPRYPIFGNQNATIFQSYNLPIENYLNYDIQEEHFIFRFNFIYSHFKKFANKYELDIILPSMTSEWTSQLNLDKKYTLQEEQVQYGFLDLYFGKKKLKFKTQNIGEKDNVQLVIKYKMSNIYLFIKPICLSLIIFIFYIALIFANRFNFAIRTNIHLRRPFKKAMKNE